MSAACWQVVQLVYKFFCMFTVQLWLQSSSHTTLLEAGTLQAGCSLWSVVPVAGDIALPLCNDLVHNAQEMPMACKLNDIGCLCTASQVHAQDEAAA